MLAETPTDIQKFLSRRGHGRPGAANRTETPLVELVVYFWGITKPLRFRLFAHALKKLCWVTEVRVPFPTIALIRCDESALPHTGH